MSKLLMVLLLLIIPIMVNAADIVVTNDITMNTTWTSDNTYILNGLIFVDTLITLTIQPGTVIKGYEQSDITSGDGASALIIRRGAKLMANGTATNPIIFTSELDDVNDPDDLLPTDKELWGGLILLGRATTNQPDTSKNQIEGIPFAEDARYGGSDDGDNSGVLRYISIRHGGFSISGIPGDEINGLTMGAVGSGTTIDHIEVFANFDDGYEWFGGTVNTKYMIAAFCSDDGFDYDQGFRGKGQFWFCIQGADEAGRGGEHDGGDDDETGLPYSIPEISNATYIGSGVGSTPGGEGNDRCLYFRDNAGGKYYSSIFTDFVNIGLTVEDLASGDDSRIRLEQGDLVLNNNFWWGFGAGSDWIAITDTAQWLINHLTANNNQLVNPQITSISRTQNSQLDPRPSSSGPAASGASVPSDPFFTQVNYYGAFDPNAQLWTYGWTALSQDNVTNIVEKKIVNVTLPKDFSLYQNYPNPFNPSTTIEYSVAERGHVNITVFNALGQRVATLVNGERLAGEYRITWDASGLSSGIYFYQLKTESTVLTRKMILMR